MGYLLAMVGTRWAFFMTLAALVACDPSSGGDRPGTRPGADLGGGGIDGGGAPIDSGGPIGVDSGPPRDFGPVIDGGCDLMEPVMNEIVGDPPDMLLTVDISGSMCTPLIDSFPVGDTKMAIMKTALNDLVASKDARTNFGLMLFPGTANECAPGTIENPIMERNGAAIMSTISGLDDAMFSCPFSHPGATPTGPSLDAARSYYGTIPVNEIGRYVLLATDGQPNCGPELPDGGTEETIDETVAAIEALYAAGIETYVLGFGDGITASDMNRMAAAGGTGTPYSARSAADLDTALDAIAAEIIPASCTIALGGASRDPSLLQVSFDDGPLIPRNEARTSGWDYDEATNTITFYGSECDQLQSGSVDDVNVDFGCPGPLI